MANRDEDPIPESQATRFSLEQLARFVMRIDGTVRISVEWSTRHAGFFASAQKR